MNVQGLLLLAARVLIAVLFLPEGYAKLTHIEGTAGYIASAGLPMPQLLAVGAGALELITGVLLIVGLRARWAALALALFTLVATALFHQFWAVPADQQFVQKLMFMKNLAITGGLLYVFSFGAGALSLDGRKASA